MVRYLFLVYIIKIGVNFEQVNISTSHIADMFL